MNIVETKRVPLPKEIKSRFIIPREYIREIAEWLDLSESMTYQMLRLGRKPSNRTKQKLWDNNKILPATWLHDIDVLAETVYSIWYASATVNGVLVKK